MAAIGTIAVIGAARRGTAIAQQLARAGFITILEDIFPSSLRKSEDEIRRVLEGMVASGQWQPAEAQAALERIGYASSVEEAARAADLVIEAVPDELESKLEILTLLDKICRPATILAVSSPSFSVAELARVTYRPGQVIGMRFTFSGNGAERVEIVVGAETGAETAGACVAAARQISENVAVTEEREGAAALPPVP